MAIRYTPDDLKHLRDSPLVVKPPALPPIEQWMGPIVDPSARNANRTSLPKNQDTNALLEQANRRPQHLSRNNTNTEHIILGPPKTNFMSATSNRNSGRATDSPDRPTLREPDNPKERFSFRGKNGDGEDDRPREGRNNLLRPKRNDGDQDSDGWSTVKPRKSFGTEGAERFNGRMGGGLNREDKKDDIRRDERRDDRRREDGREDRRFRDRDDRDSKDRPQRGFDTFSREKEPEHDQARDNNRNSGMGRGGRGDSWFNRDNDGPAPNIRDRNSNGDKFVDRNRGWREKNHEERENDRGNDRGGDRRGDRNERNDRGDRRWGNRDERQEREPEWMDEPTNGKQEAHTQDEFQKWKDSMHKDSTGAPKATMEDVPPKTDDMAGSFFELEKLSLKVETPLAIESGPDKFFGMWATPKDETPPDSAIESKKEGAAKGRSTGKASRFTSFFTPQEEPLKREVEVHHILQAPPPPGIGALFNNNTQSPEDKAAFQQLLQKLQTQSNASGSTPPPTSQYQPPPPAPERQRNIPVSTPESFQQYRTERQEERPGSSARNSQQALQDLLTQRNFAGSQPSVRPEQMLQELVGQRHNAQSQSSQRPDQNLSRSNSDFLMGLMRNVPQPQRTEEALLRLPSRHGLERQQLQHQLALEQETQHAARERAAGQRQVRPQAPPGFFDDAAFHRPAQHERQPQPTQILQRPPPGLDQMQPGWAQSPSGLGPQQQIRPQHIAPPPGLASRGLSIAQQQMFAQGYMGNNFPPPDARMQPPPGFFNAPPPAPPGFMPPGINGFHGPDSLPFGGGPYDGRGPPPPGGFRRQ